MNFQKITDEKENRNNKPTPQFMILTRLQFSMCSQVFHFVQGECT